MTKYLTASELQITENEREYLIRAHEILRDMDKGDIVPIPNDGTYLFNMNIEWEQNHSECGTAGCIMGLCQLLAETDGKNFAVRNYIRNNRSIIQGYSQALQNLFFPDRKNVTSAIGSYNPHDIESTPAYQDIPPKMAANAIYGFLTTNTIWFE